MVEINYKSHEDVEEEKQTLERHLKAWNLVREVLGPFVGVERQYVGKEFQLKDFFLRKIAYVDSRGMKIDLRKSKWEKRIVAFAEKLEETGIGTYKIETTYPCLKA